MVIVFTGFVYRTKTMNQLCCCKSKFPTHFVFTLGRYLNLLSWSSFFNVDANYSCSLENIVNYSYFGSCLLFLFEILGDKWVASVLDLHWRRRCTKFKKSLVIGVVNSHGLAWAKWIVLFHGTWQSLMVLLFLVCQAMICWIVFVLSPNALLLIYLTMGVCQWCSLCPHSWD